MEDPLIEVKLWNRALPDEEVMHEYRRSKKPNLLCRLWQFVGDVIEALVKPQRAQEMLELKDSLTPEDYLTWARIKRIAQEQNEWMRSIPWEEGVAPQKSYNWWKMAQVTQGSPSLWPVEDEPAETKPQKRRPSKLKQKKSTTKSRTRTSAKPVRKQPARSRRKR